MGYSDSWHVDQLYIRFENISELRSRFVELVHPCSLEDFVNLGFLLEKLVFGVSWAHECLILAKDLLFDGIIKVHSPGGCNGERLAIIIDVILFLLWKYAHCAWFVESNIRQFVGLLK